jgi:hypothetical protein
MNDRSWIVNDHHDRFRIDRGLFGRYSFNQSSLGLSFPRIYVIGDLPSDPKSEESIPCLPAPTLTKWISHDMPLSSGNLTESPYWLMISPGNHATTTVQDGPGKYLSGTRV